MSLTHEKKKTVRKICTKYTTNQLEKQTTVQSHRSTNQRHSWTIVLPGIGQQARLSAKKKTKQTGGRSAKICVL